MLPLTLLRNAQDHEVLVELKSGETYNGHLANCDTWMNIHLKDVICTSKDGDKFWSLKEVYLRGNNVKYIRIPDKVLDQVHEDTRNQRVKEDQFRKSRIQERGGGGRHYGRSRGRATPPYKGGSYHKGSRY